MGSGIFSRHADTVGDGTGNGNANVDGSGTPVSFIIKPRENEQGLSVARMIVQIRDTGLFSAEGYGALGELTTGIQINVLDERPLGAVINRSLTNSMPIKSNADWGGFCFDVNYLEFGLGSSDNFYQCRWTFSKSGRPIQLSNTQSLAVTISDDLRGLVSHTFMFEGIYNA